MVQSTCDLEFVCYTEDFLELSWGWLRDPEIKRLTMAPDFTKEEQLQFFKKLPYLDNYKIWGMLVNGEKAGACGLKNIECQEAELWCYIGLKKFWGMGLSSNIISQLQIESAKINIKCKDQYKKTIP